MFFLRRVLDYCKIGLWNWTCKLTLMPVCGYAGCLEASHGGESKGRLLALPTNDRLGQRRLTMTNTLAYSA
jgi:hypothetical protein